MEEEIIQGQHFVERGFTSHAKFLSDEAYGEALDSLVLACVDIVLTNDSGAMLLGKRSREPHPDWWIIGGRMRPGESFEEAASRNIRRELGLEINPTRFQYLCTYSLAWARRAQEPKENGSHCVSITMILRAGGNEIPLIEHNDEYEDLQWIHPKEVLAHSSFHPAILMIAKNVQAFLEIL